MDTHSRRKPSPPFASKIQALYPELKLGSLRGGIRIESSSLPAITPRSTVTVEQVYPALVAIVPAPELAPPPLVKIANERRKKRRSLAVKGTIWSTGSLR